ncbi:MAG TPA: hypothetical protein VK427_05630 [Kofleriaceae bacterium]|nr:hypothetical protein [Kofleriaceae bacterium]
MGTHIGFVVVTVALLACKSKEAVDVPPAKPVERVTTTKPSVRLAADEALADIKDGTNPTSWTAGNQAVEVAVISKNDKAWVRAYLADRQVDVTTPVELRDGEISLAQRQGGTALHLRIRSLSGRVEGVGTVFAYEDSLITWDAAAAKPLVSDRWTCDEMTARGDECSAGPAWTSDRPIPPRKLRPTFAGAAFTKLPDDAAKAATLFTTALMNDDREAIVAMLAPDVSGCGPAPDKLADVQAKIRQAGARTALNGLATCSGTTCTWPDWEVVFDAKTKRLGVEPKDADNNHGYILQNQGAWRLSSYCAHNGLVDPTIKAD